MQNKDNNELINDILNEIDANNNNISVGEKNISKPEDSTQESYEISDIDNTDDSIENEEALHEDVKIRKAPESLSHPSGSRNKASHPNGKKNKKKKKKKQRNRLPGVLILTTFIFAVSICLSLVIIAYGKDMLGIGKSENPHLIVIPEGATTEEISLMLEENGIIKSPEFFQLFSRLSKSDSKYIAGEHFVRPNMAYETIIQELTSIENSKKQSVEVTFPEGITLYDAAVILEENGVCSVDDFIFYFNSGGLGFEFEEKITATSNLKFYRMEGYVFPDTYYFYVDMDPEEVCQKIYNNFENKMKSEVEIGGKHYSSRYERMEELNMSLDQLITLSSIVQREAATKDTMTMVASIFWNRLDNPEIFPLLQSDPTTNYAEDVIKPHMAVYNQVMIDAYDTYKGAGLPPGAISNPGTDAIDAVLEKFESDYFYFIANVKTGMTYYSATLEEHEANQEMIKQQIADAEAASKAAAAEGGQ